MARRAPGADRTAVVLSLMAEHPDERFTLSEVSRRCGINKATAHALLTALSRQGLLLRHPREKRYSLGPVLVTIGEAARRGYSAAELSPFALMRVAEVTGWRPVLSRLVDDDTIAIAVDATPWGAPLRPGDQPLSLRLPHMPPLGATHMAWSDQATVELWLARSPSLEVLSRVGEALPAVRRHRFAVLVGVPGRPLLSARHVDRSREELQEHLADLGQRGGVLTSFKQPSRHLVAKVAAPVFDSAGRVALVLGAAPPEPESDGTMLRGGEVLELGAQLVAVADELTEAVHGRRPPT